MWDARCVYAVLMRRYELLPDADPKDYYWVVKQLVHRRNALVRTKSALLQQFHEQIQYDYPSYKKFFHEVECNTSIVFFERYPSSQTLEETTVEELGEFLRIPSHNACSTKRAKKILELVEADAVKAHDYQFGRDLIIQSMMRNIRFILDELKRIDRLQKKLLKEVDYHLETLPGKNQGNRELYSMLYLLAMQQVHVNTKGQARNPVLRAYFESKVSAGKTKIQALLCIMRRLVNIIYSMMKNNTVYRMPELPVNEATDD